MVFCDEEVVSLCHTVLRLTLSDSEVTKKVFDKDKVSQLINLSENKVWVFIYLFIYFGKCDKSSFHMAWLMIPSVYRASYPKGSEAASVLLYNLWNDKNLHSTVKKVIEIKIFFLCVTEDVEFLQEYADKHIVLDVRLLVHALSCTSCWNRWAFYSSFGSPSHFPSSFCTHTHTRDCSVYRNIKYVILADRLRVLTVYCEKTCKNGKWGTNDEEQQLMKVKGRPGAKMWTERGIFMSANNYI